MSNLLLTLYVTQRQTSPFRLRSYKVQRPTYHFVKAVRKL